MKNEEVGNRLDEIINKLDKIEIHQRIDMLPLDQKAEGLARIYVPKILKILDKQLKEVKKKMEVR